MLKQLDKLFYKDILIENIRVDNHYYYNLEGHGGEKIEKWPVYDFFCQYVQGNKGEAKDSFANWYKNQFLKYHDKPKNLGGMYKGSLYLLIEKELLKEGLVFNNATAQALFNNDYFCKAIEKRVEQRFELLNSIAKNGYILNYKDPIVGVKSGSCIVLKAGHHRVAALKAIGYDKVPQVMVYQNDKVYKVMKKIREIVKA